VQALNGIIFGPAGIRSSQDLHDPCNLLLSGVLARNQGYCVGVAAVYLAVADELNLPVHAVGTPSHVFLRYDDGATRINIETFNGGASVSDKQYVTQNRIAPVSVQKGVFLEDLTTERFLAQVHNNLGVIYSERRDFQQAAAEYREASRLDRRLPAAWYNLGKDRFEQQQFKEAISAFSKALKLHPNDTWALNNRAMTYRDLKRPDRARVDLDLALRIDPGFEQARQNLAAIGAKRDSP
jgi:tetratricopeptide (TPR) repeat protein